MHNVCPLARGIGATVSDASIIINMGTAMSHLLCGLDPGGTLNCDASAVRLKIVLYRSRSAPGIFRKLLWRAANSWGSKNVGSVSTWWIQPLNSLDKMTALKNHVQNCRIYGTNPAEDLLPCL